MTAAREAVAAVLEVVLEEAAAIGLDDTGDLAIVLAACVGGLLATVPAERRQAIAGIAAQRMARAAVMVDPASCEAAGRRH
jgi:hypothetical protein